MRIVGSEETRLRPLSGAWLRWLDPVPSPRKDNTVPSLDERPSICNPLEFAVFDQEYFHRYLTSQSCW
jgi:hypothetical protein